MEIKSENNYLRNTDGENVHPTFSYSTHVKCQIFHTNHKSKRQKLHQMKKSKVPSHPATDFTTNGLNDSLLHNVSFALLSFKGKHMVNMTMIQILMPIIRVK